MKRFWRRFDDVIAFDPPSEREVELLLAVSFHFPHISILQRLSVTGEHVLCHIERFCIDAIKKGCAEKAKSVSELSLRLRFARVPS